MKLRTGLLLALAWHLAGCAEPRRPASPESEPSPANPPRRDNIVVITIDTLRADALGIYGNSDGHSPRLDAWAADAVIFDRALTAVGTTFPSHATLFTGLYPKHHGVRQNTDRLDDRFTTLAEILSDAGYDTASFVSLGPMLRRGGLHQGIDTASDGPETKGPARPGSEVNEMAIPWLTARGERPFFLWLHYFEPHSPYPLTPFAREQLAGYTGPLAEGASVKTFYRLGDEIPWTPEEMRAVRVLYDAQVREVDRAVGEILELLQRPDLISKTTVFVTADHGQALGEHGETGHAWGLRQPVLHVPLIARFPDVQPRRIAHRVGLVDLVPTVLDRLSLPVPQGLDGTSLLPLLDGQPLPHDTYFAEVRHSRVLWPEDRSIAVFDGDLKGIFKPGESYFFDLEDDPQELSPLTGDFETGSQAALKRLAADYHRTEVEVAQPEVSEAVRKELEALGYIE